MASPVGAGTSAELEASASQPMPDPRQTMDAPASNAPPRSHRAQYGPQRQPKVLRLAALMFVVARLDVWGAHAQTADDFDPRPDGEVHAFAVQTDGKILVGGEFTTVGGVARQGLARLLPDGTVDPTFPAALAGDPFTGLGVDCLAIQADGKIIVGGQFQEIAGWRQPYLARLYPDGSIDTGFNPQPDGPVRALALQANGKIVVVGQFLMLGFEAHHALGRLNADGSVDASFQPSAGSAVNTVALQPYGDMWVGGLFSTLNGQARAHFGGFAQNGVLLANPVHGADAEVWALAALPRGAFIAGGDFALISGENRSRLAWMDGSGLPVPGWNPGANGRVMTVAAQADHSILVGGGFSGLGGQARDGLGRLLPDARVEESFALDSAVSVRALAIQPDGKILVGGTFEFLGMSSRRNLGRLENPTLATQSLAYADSKLTWRRGGSSPEVWRVTFETTTDGVNWTSLGDGVYFDDGWEHGGVTLAPGATVRARGWVTSGAGNGSTWFVETRLDPPAAPPRIVLPPINQTLCAGAGQGTTFKVVAEGNGPFTYQWRKDGVDLEDNPNFRDVHSDVLQIAGLAAPLTGSYDVVVRNAAGSVTSAVAVLTVWPLPSLLTQPSPASLWREPGESVAWSVTATDALPLTYQWRRNGVALPGQTASTLRLTNLQRDDAGLYDVVVANPHCQVASEAVGLQLNLFVPDSFAFGSGTAAIDCRRFAVQPDGKLLVFGTLHLLGVASFDALVRLDLNGLGDPAFAPVRTQSLESLHLQTDGKILLHASPDLMTQLQADGTQVEAYQLWGGPRRVYSCGTSSSYQQYAEKGAFDAGGNYVLSYVLSERTEEKCSWIWLIRDVIGYQQHLQIRIGWHRWVSRLDHAGHVQEGLVDEPAGLEPFSLPHASVSALTFQPDGRILVGSRPWNPGQRPLTLLCRRLPNGAIDPSFACDVGGGDHVNCLVVQANGQILVAGNFESLGGQPRRFFGRLHPDGTVDQGFDASVDGPIGTILLQTDGKILLQGEFSTVNRQPRPSLARLNPDGTLDRTLNPVLDGPVDAIALQPDGRLLVGGRFTKVQAQQRMGLARLLNSEPATAKLSFDSQAITWLRGGSSPEVWRTTFEASTDGVNWTPLGAGTRVAGGWQLTGLTLPSQSRVRARGFVVNGGRAEYLVESYAGAPTVLGLASREFPEPGHALTLSAPIGGSDSFTFQWFKGNVALTNDDHLSGATTAHLTLAHPSDADAGEYSVRAESPEGIVTAPVATLAFGPPHILRHPAGLTLLTDQAARFSVAVEGTPPLAYRWRKNGVPIDGAGAAAYAIVAATPGDAGAYDVEVSNGYGSVTSHAGELRILREDTDTDTDGLPDVWELAQGLDPFSSADAAVDPDGDEVTNVDEFREMTEHRDAESFRPRLVVQAGAGGTVSWTPEGSSLIRGTVVTLTAIPAAGHAFVNWGGAAVGTSLTTQITANAHATVTAAFRALQPGTIQFGQRDWFVNETAGSVTLTATRSDGTDGAVSVAYQLAPGGTAAAGTDFTLTPGKLDWNDGEAGPKSFTLAIHSDQIVEAAETIRVALAVVLGGATLGTPAVANVTIAEVPRPPELAVAGRLFVDLRAADVQSGASRWPNRAGTGDFQAVGTPVYVADVGGSGVAGVRFNASSPARDAYSGPVTTADLHARSDCSIEVWAYNPAIADEETLVAWGRRGGPDGSNRSFNYGANATWGAVGHWGASDLGWSAPAPAAGQWHYLAYTFDGVSTARVFANGRLKTTATVTLNTHADLPVRLGAQANAAGTGFDFGQAFSGFVASVRVHTGALSEADVANNYLFGPTLSPPGGVQWVSVEASRPTLVGVRDVGQARVMVDFANVKHVDLTGFSTLESSDRTVLTVDAAGAYTALGIGTARLRATYQGLAVETTLQVIAPPPVALQHRYSFSEPPGSTQVRDSVGAADGVLRGQGGHFDGAGQLVLPGGGTSAATPETIAGYVDLPNSIISRLANASFETWVTWDAGTTASAWQRIFDFGTSDGGEDVSTGNGNYLFLSPQGDTSLRFAVRDPRTSGEPTQLTAPSSLPHGQQIHLAVVYDYTGDNARLYREGLLVSSGPAAVPLHLINDVNNWLGRSQWGADPMFQGKLNEFRIWGGALSPEQVVKNFEAGPNANLGAPVDPFPLEIVRSGDTVILGWSSQDAGFVLESTASLARPGDWAVMDVRGAVVEDGMKRFAIPLRSAAQYFRMRGE